MKYVDMIHLLQEKLEVSHVQQGKNPSVRTLHLLDETGPPKWTEETLYIGDLDRYKSILPEAPLMLITDRPPDKVPAGSEVATVPLEQIDEAVRFVGELIAVDLQTRAALFSLANRALEGTNIVSLMNAAAAYVGNALILVNANQKILSYSTNYEIKDPLWLENVEKGYYSHDFKQKVRNNPVMRRWKKHDGGTKVIALDKDRQPKVVSRITKDGHLLGALVMIAHHKSIETAHHIQLPLIGKLLFDSLTIDPFNRAHSSIYSHILFNLLDETDAPEIREIIDISKAAFPEKMYVIVTRFVQQMKNRFLKQSIKIELESLFPEGYSVQYKGYIGILVPTITEEQTKALTSLTEQEDISIGISWPFDDIMDFKRHFNQAVATIKLSTAFGQSKTVHHYDRFATYDLLQHYQGYLPLENYCHPSLEILEAYDAANHTELHETLRVYLEQSKRLTTTSEALFIHKNSLTYRLARIVELTGLELDRPETLYTLLQTFAIKRFLRVSSPDEPNPT